MKIAAYDYIASFQNRQCCAIQQGGKRRVNGAIPAKSKEAETIAGEQLAVRRKMQAEIQ